MTSPSGQTLGRFGRSGLAALALTVVLFASMTPTREALAQEEPRPAPAEGGDAKARGFETIKLDNGAEVQVETWGPTYPAYDYQPLLDILDKRVHVVLDQERNRMPGHQVTTLQVDSKGSRLSWCEGRTDPRPSGRVLRSRLDGRGVQVLANGRVDPRNLLLDLPRGRLY